jgi:hemerythrin superfamily protein
MSYASNGQFGRLATGAAIGLAAGLAIPAARKALMQAPSLAAGGWADALKAEHRMVEKAFQLALDTTERDVAKREMLLMKIAYALTKHAVEEENVIYPALVQHGREDEARRLVDDHGQVKTFIFELKALPSDDPRWRTTLQTFFTGLQSHIREEEEEVFPAFEAMLPAEENARLAKLMNWEGFKVA